jgi:hypothetical protein
MLPTIPEATDLQSAINAINAIRRIMQTLIQPPHPVSGGITGFKLQQGRGFQEVRQRRVTRRVRIFNPQDKSQWVDVDQIVGMVMADPITGQTWTWQQ